MPQIAVDRYGTIGSLAANAAGPHHAPKKKILAVIKLHGFVHYMKRCMFLFGTREYRRQLQCFLSTDRNGGRHNR